MLTRLEQKVKCKRCSAKGEAQKVKCKEGKVRKVKCKVREGETGINTRWGAFGAARIQVAYGKCPRSARWVRRACQGRVSFVWGVCGYLQVLLR